jgi:hypothetical protein
MESQHDNTSAIGWMTICVTVFITYSSVLVPFVFKEGKDLIFSLSYVFLACAMSYEHGFKIFWKAKKKVAAAFMYFMPSSLAVMSCLVALWSQS